jgi:uncharacterized protein YukE
MNSLKTLYFPATDIYSIRQYPIFLLFQKIQIIQAVEHGPFATEAEQPLDTFIKSGFCQVDTPVPLGDDLNRFRSLVQDIACRTDDYSAQLSSLTLGSLSEHTDKAENSEQAIIEKLLSPGQVEKDSERATLEARLWQARLILSIAEVLDRKEEEIASSLADLDKDTRGLLQELQGEFNGLQEEGLSTEIYQMERQLGAPHAGNIKKRCRAWQTLFLQSTHTNSSVFLTTIQDAGDNVITTNEKMAGPSPLQLYGLTVPALLGTSVEQALAALAAFAKTNHQLQKDFQSRLERFADSELSRDWARIEQEYHQLATAWNRAVEKSFAAEQFGRTPVTVTLFPGTNCATIMGYKKSAGPMNGIMVVVD